MDGGHVVECSRGFARPGLGLEDDSVGGRHVGWFLGRWGSGSGGHVRDHDIVQPHGVGLGPVTHVVPGAQVAAVVLVWRHFGDGPAKVGLGLEVQAVAGVVHAVGSRSRGCCGRRTRRRRRGRSRCTSSRWRPLPARVASIRGGFVRGRGAAARSASASAGSGSFGSDCRRGSGPSRRPAASQGVRHPGDRGRDSRRRTPENAVRVLTEKQPDAEVRESRFRKALMRHAAEAERPYELRPTCGTACAMVRRHYPPVCASPST